MNKVLTAALAASVAVSALSTAAFAEGKKIGVSWSNFQEERWKTDEAAMKSAIEANGDSYISADAQSSAAKQLTDVESLIAQGADALVILSVDSGSVGAAVDAASAEGIPVLGYDRLIEDNRAFYLTFDNKEVGRVIARSIQAAVPSGNYAIIKGDKGDPNALFLLEGMMDVIGADVESGKIKIVGEAFTDGWKPDNAQKNMEQILTANNNNVDAVMSENDGMAGGAIAALQAQGMNIPVSGQDGDHAALNRVARGTQNTSVWKDARQLGAAAGNIAAALADGVIDDLATRAADSREADIRSGQTDLIGVTLQPRGEKVPPVQPAFGHLRRPAAPVEALRRTVSQQSPRILLLRGPADNAGAQEKLARRWLDVAGMQAVALAHDDSDAIAAARPDGVIICGCDDAGAMDVVMGNDALPDVCRVTAEALAASDDKLGLLASLLPEGGSA